MEMPRSAINNGAGYNETGTDDAVSYTSDEKPRNYAMDDPSDSTGSSLRSLSRELVETAEQYDDDMRVNNVGMSTGNGQVCVGSTTTSSLINADSSFQYRRPADGSPALTAASESSTAAAALKPYSLRDVLNNAPFESAFRRFLETDNSQNLLLFHHACEGWHTKAFEPRRSVSMIKKIYMKFSNVFSMIPNGADIERKIIGRLPETLGSPESGSANGGHMSKKSSFGIEIFDDAKRVVWEQLEVRLRLFHQSDEYCALQNKIRYGSALQAANKNSLTLLPGVNDSKPACGPTNGLPPNNQLRRTLSASKLVTLNEDETHDAAWGAEDDQVSATSNRGDVARRPLRGGVGGGRSQGPPPVARRAQYPPGAEMRRNFVTSAGQHPAASGSSAVQPTGANTNKRIVNPYFTNYTSFTPNSKQPTEISSVPVVTDEINASGWRQRLDSTLPAPVGGGALNNTAPPHIIKPAAAAAYFFPKSSFTYDDDDLPKTMYEQNHHLAMLEASSAAHQDIAQRQPKKYFEEQILPKLWALEALIAQKGDDARFLSKNIPGWDKAAVLTAFDAEQVKQKMRKVDQSKQKVEQLLQQNGNGVASNNGNVSASAALLSSSKSKLDEMSKLNAKFGPDLLSSPNIGSLDDILDQHMSSSAAFKPGNNKQRNNNNNIRNNVRPPPNHPATTMPSTTSNFRLPFTNNNANNWNNPTAERMPFCGYPQYVNQARPEAFPVPLPTSTSSSVSSMFPLPPPVPPSVRFMQYRPTNQDDYHARLVQNGNNVVTATANYSNNNSSYRHVPPQNDFDNMPQRAEQLPPLPERNATNRYNNNSYSNGLYQNVAMRNTSAVMPPMPPPQFVPSSYSDYNSMALPTRGNFMPPITSNSSAINYAVGNNNELSSLPVHNYNNSNVNGFAPCTSPYRPPLRSSGAGEINGTQKPFFNHQQYGPPSLPMKPEVSFCGRCQCIMQQQQA